MRSGHGRWLSIIHFDRLRGGVTTFLAAAAPIIPVYRPSFSRVPPGVRSIHPHKCHGKMTVWKLDYGGGCGREISLETGMNRLEG